MFTDEHICLSDEESIVYSQAKLNVSDCVAGSEITNLDPDPPVDNTHPPLPDLRPDLQKFLQDPPNRGMALAALGMADVKVPKPVIGVALKPGPSGDSAIYGVVSATVDDKNLSQLNCCQSDHR